MQKGKHDIRHAKENFKLVETLACESKYTFRRLGCIYNMHFRFGHCFG